MARNTYARPKATAGRMIDKNGQGVIVRRYGAPTGPAHDPTPGAPADHPSVAVKTAFRLAEIDGTRIKVGDEKWLLAKGDLTIDPKTSDKFVVQDLEKSIIYVEPLAPGGVVVLYELGIRR